MNIKNVIEIFEKAAPLQLQESYDNAGLIIGSPKDTVSGILLSIDVTEEVVDEAIKLKCNLIISHHPIIFKGIKKLNKSDYIEKTIVKAIENQIAIYSAHTNLDSIVGGVNSKICEKLQLKNCRILSPVKNQLLKLVTFVPPTHLETVRESLFSAGAGHIGNYEKCGFSVAGSGSFLPLEHTNPFVGKKGEIHFENEFRFETIFPEYLASQVISALLSSHPYEEVAYDIYPLKNEFPKSGMGMYGELELEMEESEFLKQIQKIFDSQVIRYTNLMKKPIKKVAVCGGSGIFLLQKAINIQADIFITGDVKYHEFFDANGKILLADIGHFESEQFTVEVFYDLLKKNLPNFAVHFTSVKTNPINYLFQ